MAWKTQNFIRIKRILRTTTELPYEVYAMLRLEIRALCSSVGTCLSQFHTSTKIEFNLYALPKHISGTPEQQELGRVRAKNSKTIRQCGSPLFLSAKTKSLQKITQTKNREQNKSEWEMKFLYMDLGAHR